MTCIDLMSKRSKQRKTPNAIKLRWICIDLTSKWSKMLSYVANHSKPLNYKSDQIGRQNDLKCWVTSQIIQNNAKLQKWSKKQWLASIWCQNDQSNAKLQTRSNYVEFVSIWRPNDQKCWVTSQTIQNR